MINILILLVSIQFFTIELREFKLNDNNNTIYIILNDVYCHDCLKTMDVAIKELNSTFKIAILRKSQNKEQSVWANFRFFDKSYKFDTLLFFNDPNSREISKLMHYDIKKTPALLIIKDHKEYFIPYDLLFANNFDKNRIKKEIKIVTD